MIENLLHFCRWYKQLRKKGYGRIISFDSAIYNYKHYKLDGSYR